MEIFFNTYYDTNYISREPNRYLFDVYSIGYVFQFSKQLSITPVMRYNLKDKTYEKYMNIVKTNVDGLHKIIYGPLFFNEYTVNPSNIRISIILNDKSKKIIFKKKIKLLDFKNFSRKPFHNNFDLTFAVCSCFNLSKFLTEGRTNLKTLKKFNEVCKEKNPLMIISSGDIVYFSDTSISSSYAIQNAYDSLITLKESQSMWSNYTWVCANDDHELSFNNGLRHSENIQLLRNKMNQNFPVAEQSINPYSFRSAYFSLKNIYFILLDTVTEQTLYEDANVVGYKSILGNRQLSYLINYLGNIVNLTGPSSLIFIVVGKSMFSTDKSCFLNGCANERNEIFNYIKNFKLKNIVFICGDTHLSDFTEHKLEDTGITVREIRNSSVTSTPRSFENSDNPLQYSGSLSQGVNNFGFINVNGSDNKYKVTYTNHTLKGEQFKYSWKMDS
jgi:hypothetical protein